MLFSFRYGGWNGERTERTARWNWNENTSGRCTAETAMSFCIRTWLAAANITSSTIGWSVGLQIINHY